MNRGRTIFSQIMDVFPHAEFQKCVARYKGDRRTRSFSCHDQFMVMAFAQLTFRESLRDIEVCLQAMSGKLYHMGIRGNVSRTTLADANERRDWRLFRDFALVLAQRARALYANEPLAVALDNTIYAFDSTTIDLCLSMFPWARFRRAKGAVKLHTLLDLRGSIPAFLLVSEGRMNDVRALDAITPEVGAFYLMDRGYVDYERLYHLHSARAFFVTRAKATHRFRRQSSSPVDKTQGLRCDQRVTPRNHYPALYYPEHLRRISFVDTDKATRYIFLTNNFKLPALTIAELYRCRWQVETFFKWIKQHLRIKAFYGTSINAVKTQIWTAMATYLLIAILKKQLHLESELHTLLQVFSLTLFEKIPVFEAVSHDFCTLPEDDDRRQLTLFDF
jgi:transposase